MNWCWIGHWWYNCQISCINFYCMMLLTLLMGKYYFLMVWPLKEANEGWLVRLSVLILTSIIMVYTWWWCSFEPLYAIRSSRWWNDDCDWNILNIWVLILWFRYDEIRLILINLCALLWYNNGVLISQLEGCNERTFYDWT